MSPVKFEISMLVEVNDEGVLSTSAKLHVDGEPIGLVSRLRVDYDSDDATPAVQIDMLRGADLGLLDEGIVATAKRHFELLRKVPGVRCAMPAPRSS
jgi:hypothetical protein